MLERKIVPKKEQQENLITFKVVYLINLKKFCKKRQKYANKPQKNEKGNLKAETLLRHFFISNIMLSYLNIPDDVKEGKGASFDKCFFKKGFTKILLQTLMTTFQ